MEFDYSVQAERGGTREFTGMFRTADIFVSAGRFWVIFFPSYLRGGEEVKKTEILSRDKASEGVHQKNETNQPSGTTTTATVNFLHARTHRIVRH